MERPAGPEHETAGPLLTGAGGRALDVVLGLAVVSLIPLGLTVWAEPSLTHARVPLVGGELLLAVALYTLRQYLHTRGGELRAYLGGPDTGHRAARVALEFLRLTLLEALALSVDLGKLALGALCFAAFVLDNLLLALLVFGGSLCAALNLDRLSDHLRGKLHRFYHFDGVVLSREGGEPPPPKPWTRRPGLWERLDARFDELFYPPVTLDARESIHLVRSEILIDGQAPCRVCGQPLHSSPVVVCGACATPHHRDCFEYVARCAVYGCGCDHSHPAEVAPVEAAETASPEGEEEDECPKESSSA